MNPRPFPGNIWACCVKAREAVMMIDGPFSWPAAEQPGIRHAELKVDIKRENDSYRERIEKIVKVSQRRLLVKITTTRQRQLQGVGSCESRAGHDPYLHVTVKITCVCLETALFTFSVLRTRSTTSSTLRCRNIIAHPTQHFHWHIACTRS